MFARFGSQLNLVPGPANRTRQQHAHPPEPRPPPASPDDCVVRAAVGVRDALVGGRAPWSRFEPQNGASKAMTAVEGADAGVAHGHGPGIRARCKHRARPTVRASERTGCRNDRSDARGNDTSISHPCSIKVPRARRAIDQRTARRPIWRADWPSRRRTMEGSLRRLLATGFAAKESSDVDDPHDHSVAEAMVGS